VLKVYIDTFSNNYFVVVYFNELKDKVFFEHEKIREMKKNIGKTIRVRKENSEKNKNEILGKIEGSKIVIALSKEIGSENLSKDKFNRYEYEFDEDFLERLIFCMDESVKSKKEIQKILKEDVVQI